MKGNLQRSVVTLTDGQDSTPNKIISGHVVYEMGSGRELKDRLFPQDTDYVGMQQAVAEMVQFIFELQNTFNLVKYVVIHEYIGTPLCL